MIICVTGTPGTGKTTLAKILAKKLKYRYLDVKKLIKKNKLYEKYDVSSGSYIVDVKKLNKFLISMIKINQNLIIDSHLSHYLPKRDVDMCVVTKCELKELKKRLEKRRYSKEKIRENLDAEIFDICLNEAKENRHYTFVIRTTKRINKEITSQVLGEIDAYKPRSRTVKQYNKR
jgi:adenylate kinase